MKVRPWGCAVSLSEEMIVNLMAKSLGPSTALMGLIDDWRPRLQERFRNMEDTNLSQAIPDEGTLNDPENENSGFVKALGKARDEVSSQWAAAIEDVKAQHDQILEMFDAEFAQCFTAYQALPDNPSVEEAFADAFYDWATLTNTLIEQGPLDNSTNEFRRMSWKTTRGRVFWDAVYGQLTPDRLPSLPSGPLSDWGVAYQVLRNRVIQSTELGPHLPWLEAVQAWGADLGESTSRWTVSSPRQLRVWKQAEYCAPDPRPAQVRRDDHHLPSTASKESAWTQWIEKIGATQPHPATADWTGRIFEIKRLRLAAGETGLNELIKDMDPGLLAAWHAGNASHPQGITRQDLEEMLAQKDLLPLSHHLHAHVREQRTPALPEKPDDATRRVRSRRPS